MQPAMYVYSKVDYDFFSFQEIQLKASHSIYEVF